MYPFGSTSFQAGRSAAEVSLKRYRFTAKERDDESGFYYHGARYYMPWLARWIAADPLESKFSPEPPYNYGHNNPITWQDSTGMQADTKNGIDTTGNANGAPNAGGEKKRVRATKIKKRERALQTLHRCILVANEDEMGGF